MDVPNVQAGEPPPERRPEHDTPPAAQPADSGHESAPPEHNQPPEHSQPPPPPHPAPAAPAPTPAPVAVAPAPVAVHVPVAAPVAAPAPMAPMAAPAAAPMAAPAAPMGAPPMGAPSMGAPSMDPVGQLRSELLPVLQRIESTLSSLAMRPGEAPEERALRQQASGMSAQATALATEATAHRTRAGELRAQANLATETDRPMLLARAAEAEQIAAQREAKATELRAGAIVMNAKAMGFYPFLEAMAGLVTDEQEKTRKLITDLNTKVDSYNKLATDRAATPQGGGKVEAAAGPPPAPVRRTRPSLSASASAFAGKYGDTETGKIATSTLDEALNKAGVKDIAQRIALKTELGREGLLR